MMNSTASAAVRPANSGASTTVPAIGAPELPAAASLATGGAPRCSPGGGGSPGCAGSALSAPSGKIFERSGSRGFSFGSNGSRFRSHAAIASTQHASERRKLRASEPQASEDQRAGGARARR